MKIIFQFGAILGAFIALSLYVFQIFWAESEVEIGAQLEKGLMSSLTLPSASNESVKVQVGNCIIHIEMLTGSTCEKGHFYTRIELVIDLHEVETLQFGNITSPSLVTFVFRDSVENVLQQGYLELTKNRKNSNVDGVLVPNSQSDFSRVLRLLADQGVRSKSVYHRCDGKARPSISSSLNMHFVLSGPQRISSETKIERLHQQCNTQQKLEN